MTIRVRFMTKGCSAIGEWDGKLLTVRKGSEVSYGEAEAMQAPAHRLKMQLIEQKILIKAAKDHPYAEYIFAQSYKFEFPYLAASIIQGGHRDGYRQWKDDKGVSLRAMRISPL